MRSRPRLAYSVAAWFLVILPALVSRAGGEPPVPKGDPEFWTSQYQGLLALRSADYPTAIKCFSDALQRTPDFQVHLQRGVAYALSGDYAAAYDDLERARIPNSREPELWRICIWAVSDKAPPTAADQRGGAQWFSGIPGHMVQGRDDYDTSYASCVAYEWAMRIYFARLEQRKLDPALIAACARKAGRWFANRNLATAPMATFSFQNARRLLETNHLPEALEAVNLARTMYPDDGDIRYVSAEIYRRLGRPRTARAEYTIALTISTDSAAAYRGRALAAAAEGDQRRAKSDLLAAARYDPQVPADVVKSVATMLAQGLPTEQPAALLARLDAAATAGDPVSKLLPLAMDLHKSSAATRVRYDELYQDHLRELEDAARANPGDPAAHVAVAGYILDELDNRWEQVEPRRPRVFYRHQVSRSLEVNRAMAALGKALVIDPRNVPALVRMAYAHDAVNQTRDAENCITKVLQLVGAANAEAIRLLADYRSRQASQLMARAGALRTPTFTSSSWTENRSDGVYTVTQTTRHDPTPADLQNAALCEQQAKQIIAQAKALMESAMKQNPDSLDGLLLRARYERWFGTAEQALGALREAVRKFPTSLKAHDALVEFYTLYRMPDDAINQRMIASTLYQTTAAPLLERIWRRIHETGWETIIAYIRRARQVNPIDARATLYLSLAQADAKDAAASAASLRVAIALELARLKLDELGAGEQSPRPADDFALPMRLLDLSAQTASRDKRFDEALADYLMAAGFASRFAPGGNGQLMYDAMIPDPRANPWPAPMPVNGATLAADIYYGAGQTLKQLGKGDEAVKYFRSAGALARSRPPNTPKVGNAKGDTNFNDEASGPEVAGALLELAAWHLDRGDVDAAMAALNGASEAQPSNAQRKQINDLQMQIGRRMQPRFR